MRRPQENKLSSLLSVGALNRSASPLSASTVSTVEEITCNTGH